MPELISTISLGWTSLRALAGVITVGYSLFNKDIVGEGAKPFEKLQDAVFGEFVGGLASAWAIKAKDLTAKHFYSQIARIDRDNLNHDLQRAAHKARLIATLFACEACLQELKAEQRLQEKRPLKSVKNLIWSDGDTQWLKSVKSWIEQELKALPQSAPRQDFTHEEILRVFDSRPDRSPDEQQAQFIKEIKEDILAELRARPYEKFGLTIPYSERSYIKLKEKIDDGWDEFIPSDEVFIRLNLAERNLNFSDEVKKQDKWFWLLCSFFNEEFKTNERLKAAMLKNLLLEQRRILSGLSLTIAAFDSKLTAFGAGQTEILELLGRIELELRREPFYARYQGLESRREVDKIIKAKVEGKAFVGREEKYQRLEDFIDKGSSGYFVIKAKGGYGKTSLLARWVSRRLHQNEINYGKRIFLAHHFFNQTLDATRILNSAYTNLLRQLCTYQAREELPSEPGRLRDAIIGFINEEKPAGNEPLVIVLDGLDEAEAEIEPFGELPKGVFVIVSARADVKEQPRYLEKWLEAVGYEETNILFLDQLPKKGVEKLLRVKNFPLADDAEFLESLYQKTEGFPLYLDYLIDDLKHEPADRIKNLLDETPRKFGEYVETQYDSLCRYLSGNLGDNWAHRVETLFGVLSVSLGAVSKYDVKKLADIPETEIRGLPSKIWRWIRIQEEDGQATFSFDHDSLKEVFANEIFSDEKEKFLATLLEYCSKWEEHKPSRYALRHYPEHLLRAGRWEALYELARDTNFLSSQEREFPHDRNIVLRTLQTALRAAIDTDDAQAMTEFMLSHAHQVNRNLNESPLDALRISLERALSQAELVYLRDFERGVVWFLLLAKIMGQESRPEKAREILEQLNMRRLSMLNDEVLARLAATAFIDLIEAH